MLSSDKRQELINKYVYTGQYCVLEVLDYFENEEYRAYFSQVRQHERIRPLDLSLVEDILLRRRICEYLIDSLGAGLLPHTYYQNRILGFKTISRRAPDYYALPYNDFLKAIDEIILAVNIKSCSMAGNMHVFRDYCLKEDFADNPFALDVWDLTRFNLTYDRNYAFRFNRLCFTRFANDANKNLVKHFIEYQLTNTGVSVGHIYGQLAYLRIMLNIIDKPYPEWSEDDAFRFAKVFRGRYQKESTVTSAMITFFAFTDYLILHDFLLTNPIRKLKPMARTGSMFQHSARSVDDYVILQIYSKLDRLEDQAIKIGFLILHSVGIRCSEMVCLKRNCVERSRDSAFLNYYSVKMKKDVCNVIPMSLADMIEVYQRSLPPGVYLFPSNKDHRKPFSCSYFSYKMNQFLKENNVVNADGSQYHFSSHSMRHQIAVRMRENNVPLKYIQEQLHHNNIDMTLAYVEYLDKTKIKKMTKFLNANGDMMDLSFDEDVGSAEYADYMRNKINAQILPNGVCARPVSLGNCPHGNCCLNCKEFRTSKLNIETHRQHLKRVSEYIVIAEENGWLPQVESNRETKHRLEHIIKRLEEIPDEFAAE